MASTTDKPNPLMQFLRALTPPQPITTADYDGLEYKWKMFVFRPALFKIEAFILAGLLVYFLVFLLGKSRNAKRANAWLDAHMPLLSQQFSKPTIAGIVSDGYADFFNFSTGRRNVASLHEVFSLLPRHDLAQMLYQFGRGMYELTYVTEDVLELDFKLFTPAGAPSFVWAVVPKNYISKVKENRWDLTLTKTTENATVGQSYVVMSEFADVTDSLLKPYGNLNLSQVLNDPAYKDYIRSLSITDLPRERPAVPLPQELKERHVILSLRLPPPSQAEATIPLVKAIFTLIDNLDSKISLRPETRTKLRKIREELDDQIKKEAEAEKKEEAELDKLAAKKKAEEERISKLSAAEQKKLVEREKKRAIRKNQGKVVKR